MYIFNRNQSLKNYTSRNKINLIQFKNVIFLKTIRERETKLNKM